VVKKVKLLFLSIFATLTFCCANTSALTVVSLEKTSADSDSIELNAPSGDYQFDATFLDSNLTLEYLATIKNDESNSIKINSISLTESTHDFLEYSYDGLAVDDIIPAGGTKSFTISVRANANEPSTVTEDYDLHITYESVVPDNPPTFADSILPFSIVFIGAATVSIILTRKTGQRRHLAIIFMLPVALLLANNHASAVTPQDFHFLGKVAFTKVYTVTIDPNGGSYRENTSLTTAKVRDGQKYHVEAATRDTYSFVSWEINPSDATLDANNDIIITSDTSLKALWNEIYYQITIKPNGGKYNGNESDYTASYRPHTNAPVSTPERTGYDFRGWSVSDGSTFNGTSWPMESDITLTANWEIQHLTVTVDPNGGKFNGSGTLFTTTLDYGTVLDLSNTEYLNHEIRDWLKNNNISLAANTQSITITENTNLVINWWSSIFHTVTINPNGGVYDGKSEASSYQVRQGTNYEMKEATRTDYLFDYWHYTGTDTVYSGTEFTVESDVSLTAEWVPVIARIERTGKLYSSIMKAETEAIENDTITLLVDTSEIVTNSKKVTLDLYSHTLAGYIVNTADGNLTLINGAVDNYASPIQDTTNPTGAAVVNNGTLIMGIDDYTNATMNETTPLIDNGNIRLIGSETGLEQNGAFYFYDGHIEGNIALNGGYDGSPWYRNTFDGAVVNYFPFVTRNTTKDCQHVELSSADKAVSKTIEKGPIYYYNLQDNINTSARTGYKIYAVRDFDASYPITVAADTGIVFDIVGYTVNLGDNVTINGKLTIIDSESANNNAGLLTTSKTIQDHGELIFKDITVATLTTNTLVQNNNILTLNNSTLKGDKGTILYVPNATTTLNIDASSSMITTSSNPAVNNDSTSLVLSNGTFSGNSCTVQNNSGKTITIDGATVTGVESAVCNYNGTVNINSGTITTNRSSSSSSNINTFAVYAPSNNDNNNVININGGTIRANGTNRTNAYAVYQHRGNVTITGGTIESNRTQNSEVNNSSYGIWKYYGNINIRGGHIKATNARYSTAGVQQQNGKLEISGEDTLIEAYNTSSGDTAGVSAGTLDYITVSNGTFKAQTYDGTAYGINNSYTTLNYYNGTSIAESTIGNAYGIGLSANNDRYPSTLNMYGGSASATTGASNKMAVGLNARNIYIANGTVYGSTYGIHGNINNTWSNITIGTNADPLYNGVNTDGDGNVYPAIPEIKGGIYAVTSGNYYFYDGILKGGVAYADSPETIRAIPDGTSRVVVNLTDPTEQDCWLEYDEDYLQLPDGSTYNSLTAAYANIQDGETITVIRDASTPAAIPANTKNITFDLNGHRLTYAQPFTNNGTMAIIDSSSDKTGAIISNNSSAGRTIDNYGTLTISDISLSGNTCIILNRNGKTLTTNNVNVTGTEYGVCNYGGTYTMNGGSVTVSRSGGNVYSIYTPYGNGGGTININGGTIKAINTTGSNSSYTSTGVYQYDGTFNMTAGTIDVSSNGTGSVGISKSYGNINITGGHIKVTNNSYYGTTGLDTSLTSTYISGDDVLIEVSNYTSTGYEVSGIRNSRATTTFGKGTIRVNSNSSTAHGIYVTYRSTANVQAGADIVVHSNAGNAYGVGQSYSSVNYPTNIDMSGGSISASTDASGKLGIGLNANNITVTGGYVYGSSYGIHGEMNSRVSNVTLGTNAAPIYNGVDTDGEGHVYPANPEIKGGIYALYKGNVLFYDGILKGGTTYVDTPDTIHAIPDGTSRVVVNIADPVEQDCWLEYDEDYLQLPNGNTYNSLTAAYADMQDGETVTVIRDASTPAALPTNTKNITFDLNGHVLHYSQPLGNSGTLTITDSSAEQTGAIINNNPSSNGAINNNGTLTIDSGSITGYQCTLTNNNGKTATIENATLKATISGVCNYGGTVTMNGGNLLVSNTVGDIWGFYTPYANSGGTININGGYIKVEETGTNNTLHNVLGIYQYNGNINISGGTMEVYARDSSSPAYAHGISKDYGNINMTGGSIKVNSNARYGTAGMSLSLVTANINNASIEVTNTNNVETSGIKNSRSTTTITNSTVNVQSNAGVAYGIYITYRSTANVQNNANIAARSTSNNAYGVGLVYSSGSDQTIINMSGGSVSAVADASDKMGVGLNANVVNITGGSVYGNSYGIHGELNSRVTTTTIGTNAAPIYNGVDTDGEGHVYPANPVIRGGIYGVAYGNVYFYDGVLKGGVSAYYDRNIKTIAGNSYLHITTENIDGVDYDVKYLASEEILAKIGDTGYKSLQAAIDASQENDEIDLVADNYIFATLNIPADKKATIDFNGHEVITGNQIVNRGNISIYDSTGTPKVFKYSEANVFITNEANATLKISGIDINARFAFNNKASGTITLENLKIGENSLAETAIENRGVLNMDHVSIKATNRAVYTTNGQFNITDSSMYSTSATSNHTFANDGSSGTIANSTISTGGDGHNDSYYYRAAYYQTNSAANVATTGVTYSGYVRIEAGAFSLTDGSITVNNADYNRPGLLANGTVALANSTIFLHQNGNIRGVEQATTITNGGTLTINGGTVTHKLTNNAYYNESRTIQNTGTLNIDGTTINEAYSDPRTGNYTSGTSYAIYTTGNVTFKNANITLNRVDVYGIYAESGNVLVESGDITVNGSKTAYALWAKNGAITLGEAEDLNSINYGTANANVSTTSPNIQAFGTTYGIGVTLEGGSFNFFDGKITQNSTVGPAVQADHQTKATVTNVEYLYQPEAHTDENGHTYFILEFMRN